MLEIIVRPDAAALVASADGGRRSESHRDHGLEWGRILSASLCQHRYQQVCGQGRGRTADLPIFRPRPTAYRDDGHDKLPGDGHEAARWRT